MREIYQSNFLLSLVTLVANTIQADQEMIRSQSVITNNENNSIGEMKGDYTFLLPLASLSLLLPLENKPFAATFAFPPKTPAPRKSSLLLAWTC